MNRHFPSAVLAAALGLATLGAAGDARACAVLTPDETTPVTGHQMVLSVSAEQTTLWDRFSYTGDPASFAWILPVKGLATIDLSSDALFDALGQLTAPQVYAPEACPSSCKNDGSGGGSVGGGFGNVDVKSEKVVGPYQTVQISSQDPAALKQWLVDNGYPIPAEIGPVLDAYVSEGFDFLAMKLLPDKGLDATRPVRVTVPGAAPSVPIRLLAAGTGATTAVTLFVVGEGRYEATNAPLATLGADDLTWDYATSSSDYGDVKKAKLASLGGKAYLVEQARKLSKYELETPLQTLVTDSPDASGYGSDGVAPADALAADLDALWGGLGDPWVTRLAADLSREALAADLALGAAADQSEVDGVLYVQKTKNAPECPPDPCAGQGGAGGGASQGGAAQGGGAQGGAGPGTGAGGGATTGASGDAAASADDEEGGCAVRGPARSPSAMALVGLALAAAAARRRRR